MALSADDRAAVADLLAEHPDWPDSRIRAEAGLAPTALFSVRGVRRQLGIPPAPSDGVPGRKAGAGKAGGKGKGKGKRGPAVAESDTLDESGPDDPTGPKRSGAAAAKRPQSLLAPVLPRLAQALMVGVMSGTNTLTGGIAPMTRAEAAAVAIPSVRILDRQAAKYIKSTGKVTPDQEDMALIALTVVVWAIGWIIASIQGKPRNAGRPAPQPEAQAFAGDAGDGDLLGESFAGPPSAQETSTRSANMQPVSMGRPATLTTPAGGGDDADLFAGSEPAATERPTSSSNGSNGRLPAGVSEATWQAVMPTDLGEGLVN